MKKKILFSTVAVVAVAITAIAADTDVPYPDGYRSWQHVKSMVIQEGHPLYSTFGGIHHLYANTQAVAGYQNGSFADGSVIVFDLLEANVQGGGITEGKRKVLGVMRKDDNKFSATGGWSFEGFAGDSQTDRVVGANAASACFACHTAQNDKGYVFSEFRN